MDKVRAVEQVTLMQAIVKGDRLAFEKLYRQTSPHLFAIALRMLRHRPGRKKCCMTAFSPSGAKRRPMIQR